MTVTKDVCGLCSIGYEQLVQTCMCSLVAVSLVARGGGEVLQKLIDFYF